MKVGAGPLVMDQVPSPLANATGIDPQPGSWRTNAISVRPLPLKSPATTRTPDVFAHDPMKVRPGPILMDKAPVPLVMDQLPSPLSNATRIDPQPGSWRTNAISVRPLPLKSPATTRTPDVFAHDPMKVGAGPLVMDQVPSPLANATGIDPQPGSW